jgi:hypothetical protein
MERAVEVRNFYEAQLRSYWQAQFAAFQKEEEQAGIFLGSFLLDQSALLPPTVQKALAFYEQQIVDHDLGSTRIFRVPVNGQDTYALEVTTDGSDGWLEVYDSNGDPLGYGRTFIELVSWGSKDAIRALVDDFEFPPGFDPAKSLWVAQ